MNKYIITAATTLALLGATSCSDDIEKVEVWPEWPSKALVTVNGEELSDTYYETYSGVRVTLSEGESVVFTGIDKLRYALQDHFWKVTDNGNAVFKGATGEYDLIYDGINNLLYAERPEIKHPDALYVIGEQLGHSGAIEPISTGWTVDTPDGAQSCVRKSQNVFEISLYLGSGFKFKFFTHRGWGLHEDGIEIWAEDLTLMQPTLVQGTGDFCAGPLFQPGVYTVTVDLNAGTLNLESHFPVEEEVFYVNGVKMEPAGSYLHTRVNLNTGDEVVFGNFGGISDMLQPGFFEVVSDVEGKTRFTGVSGTYDIYLDASSMLVYAESPGMSFDRGETLWMTGCNFGHPRAGRNTVGEWKLCEPVGSYQMTRVEEGVYETTAWLSASFCAKFYKSRDWSSALSTQFFEPVPSNIVIKGVSCRDFGCVFTGDLLPAGDFTPGVYTIRADVNNHIVYLVGTLPQEDIRPVDYRINGVSMAPGRYDGYLEAVVNFTQGDKVEFANLTCIDRQLQPEYFEKMPDGTFRFKAMSGEYRVIYDADRSEYIWVERTANTGLWFTGQYFGHPRFGGWDAGDANNSIYISPAWSFDNPRQYICCAETAPGIFETSFIFHSSWAQLTLYRDRRWDMVIRSSDVDITDTSSFGRSYFWSDGVGNDTNFGCTIANIGEQYGTYLLRIDTTCDPIRVEPSMLDTFGR